MDHVQAIIAHTAVVFACTPAALLGRSRKQPIAEARQAAMWAVRQRYPSISLEGIGSAIGGRHYTTVMHALTTVKLRAANDPTYNDRLHQLLARIGATSAPPEPATLVPLPPTSRVEFRRPVHGNSVH